MICQKNHIFSGCPDSLTYFFFPLYCLNSWGISGSKRSKPQHLSFTCDSPFPPKSETDDCKNDTFYIALTPVEKKETPKTFGEHLPRQSVPFSLRRIPGVLWCLENKNCIIQYIVVVIHVAFAEVRQSGHGLQLKTCPLENLTAQIRDLLLPRLSRDFKVLLWTLPLPS